MQPAKLLNGRLTYTSGWGAVASGLILALNTLGSPELGGQPWQMMLATILSSNVPTLVIGGLAIVGFRRKMTKMQDAKEAGPEEIQRQTKELEALAAEFLAKLQQRKTQ